MALPPFLSLSQSVSLLVELASETKDNASHAEAAATHKFILIRIRALHNVDNSSKNHNNDDDGGGDSNNNVVTSSTDRKAFLFLVLWFRRLFCFPRVPCLVPLLDAMHMYNFFIKYLFISNIRTICASVDARSSVNSVVHLLLFCNAIAFRVFAFIRMHPSN